MNSKRYDGSLYPTRKITDLRDLIYQSTDMFPEHAAYLQKDRTIDKFVPITYRKVREDLDALGTRLIDMGLKDQKIAVIGDTSYYWILTYFTVVSGVGVIVPLDKNLPQNELMGLIERSGASAIVYGDKSRDIIRPLMEDPKELKYIISMDNTVDEEDGLSLRKLIGEGLELISRGDTRFTKTSVDPDQMSTLLFTSGTTGLAKGVMLSHRNIANNVIQLSGYFKIPEPGIVFSILPIHHVYAMTCDIWTTFYQGKTIAICEGLRYIQKNMSEVHPNVMLGVPLVFEKLYKGMWKQAKRRGEEEKLRNAIDLSKRLKLYRNPAIVKRLFQAIHSSFGGEIKKFVMGGAAADPFIMEEFEAMGFTMVQGYGMSECSPIIALNRDRYRKCGPVGQPVNGATVKIVNQDDEGVGEIIVKSDSVMLGYYENEEATAETIQDGWLYTGDLGYFDSDGFLYVTGRRKTVIVTKGGKNIFPEEVENVLMQEELIQEVIVHGVEDKRVGNVMVTADIYPNYTLLRERKGDMTASEVYHFYQDLIDEINPKMPPYKWVKRINIRTTEFVKTTTGKIKRYGNQLGDGSQKFDERLAYPDLKKKEVKKATAFMKAIRESEDPFVLYKDHRPINDIWNLLDTSAQMYPDRIAFYYKFRKDAPYSEITYRQLLEDVNALGTAMFNLGLGGKRIAIVGKNCYQWASSCLAVLCGTGICVPLDRKADPAELERIIVDAGVSCVIFDGKQKDTFLRMKEEGRTGITTLIDFEDTEEEGVLSWKGLIRDGKAQLEAGDRQYLDAEIIADDMAAILYTAGTTGASKGVMVSHTNMVYDIMSTMALMEIRKEDIFFSIQPMHSIYEFACGLLIPLYAGASVAFGQGLNAVEQNCKEVRPTVFLGFPLLVQGLYDKIWDYIRADEREDQVKLLQTLNKVTSVAKVDLMRGIRKEIVSALGGRLRMIISGGGPIRSEVLDFFNDVGILAIQGYGMAECSPVGAVNPSDAALADSKSVGHILPGMSVKIVEKREDGMGEICLRGENIMMGYYHDPEETARVLKDGWYHTGDVGYINADNFIYIVGRKKNIITRNGRSVYPEELEMMLTRVPYIEDAMVWGMDSEVDPNEQTVAATVFLKKDVLQDILGPGYSEDDVRNMLWEEVDRLNETLPQYKRIKKVLIRTQDFEKTNVQRIKRFLDANKEEC